MVPQILLLALISLASMALTGCASAQRAPAAEAAAKQEAAEMGVKELTQSMTALTARMEQLETKLSALNDKFDSTRTSLETFMGSKKDALVVPVTAHPAAGVGEPVVSPLAASDPDAGFAAETGIQDFRKALILIQGTKYPEATLAFGGFLEKHPDHALAGTAQFYVGESYFLQNECGLAMAEYQRVLTSYDRSPAVPDTLRRMSECSDSLKNPADSLKYRQQLLSLFPQSPAAAGLRDVKKEIPEAAAKTAEISVAESSAAEASPPPTAPVTAAESAEPKGN